MKNKKTICFYTYELFPFTGGGCGTYIRSKIDKLLEKKYEIILLFYGSEQTIENIDNLYIENENFKIFSIQDLSTNNRKYINIYKQRSWEFYLALKEICKYKKIDIVEMFEYVGIGYFTLKKRKSLPKNIKYVTRAHGSMKIIDFYEKFHFDFFRSQMYKMEKYCLVHSDIRLFPTKDIINDYNKFYNFNFLKLKNLCIPLPLDYIKKYKPIIKNKNALDFLYFSNLKKIKSPETFVEAGVIFYKKNPNYKGKFILAGLDTQYSNNLTYWQYLQELIPKNLKNKFIFLGRIDHKKLRTILKKIKTTVITSKWESFSLVFYELRKLNTDIIVRDINCFKQFKKIKKFSTTEELYLLIDKENKN